MKTDEEKKICTELAALHQKTIDGIETTEDNWKNLSDRAYMAYMAYMAYRADRADRAYMAYMADRAYRAYRADRALPMRDKLIELLKTA